MDYMQPLPGGIDSNPPPTMLDHYSWRRLGPQDDKDAVIFSAAIDASVRPTAGKLSFLPKGRIFSMTDEGTMIPGLRDADDRLVLSILVGSDSDSGDVIGVNYGDPAMYSSGASAFRDTFRANFQSLAAGYVYETTEYDPACATEFVPGTWLTADWDNINDFDTAGIIRPGKLYEDHIIGIVVQGVTPIGINQDVSGIVFQGMVIPRIKDGLALRP